MVLDTRIDSKVTGVDLLIIALFTGFMYVESKEQNKTYNRNKLIGNREQTGGW